MNNSVLTQFNKGIILCVALGIFLVPTFVQAFFSDTETSSQQQFQASELQLDTSLLRSNITVGVNQPATSTTLQVNTSALSVPAAFDIAVSNVGGDLEFCDNIQLQVQRGTVSAQAAFGAFTMLEQTVFGTYQLTVSLIDPDAVTAGETCTATIAVTAWQQNMNKATGYHDIVEHQVQITAADLAVQRLAAPAMAEGEVAGASISLPDDSKDSPESPSKKETELVEDTPPAIEVKEPVAVDPPSTEQNPVQPVSEDNSTSGSDPAQPADEPKPEPTPEPAEPVDDSEIAGKPTSLVQSEETPEQEQESVAKPVAESSPKEELEPVFEETGPEEGEQPPELPPATKQSEPELEPEAHANPEPVNEPEPEPAKLEVDELESETE